MKDLGYDGFINFEDEDSSATSIGIFNPENTKVVGKLSLEDVRCTQEFKKYYMLERRFVYNAIKIHLVEKRRFVRFTKQLRIIKEEELKSIFRKLKTKSQSDTRLILRENCCSCEIL